MDKYLIEAVGVDQLESGGAWKSIFPGTGEIVLPSDLYLVIVFFIYLPMDPVGSILGTG
jgi:hypothetical protein